MSSMCAELPALQVPARKQRVWTVFVAFLVAWNLGTVAQVMTLAVWGAARGISLGAQGVPAEQMAQVVKDETVAMMANPLVVVAFLFVPFQLVLGLVALLAARLSPEGVRARLGMVRPALPAWGLPTVMAGSLPVI